MILSDFIEMITPHPELIIVDVDSDYDKFDDTWWNIDEEERYETALEVIRGTGLEAFGLPAEEYDNYKVLAYKAILLPKYAYAEVAHLWVTDKAWFIGIYPYECKNGVDVKKDDGKEIGNELKIGDIVTTKHEVYVGMVIAQPSKNERYVCTTANKYDEGKTYYHGNGCGWIKIGEIVDFKEDYNEVEDIATWRKLTYDKADEQVINEVKAMQFIAKEEKDNEVCSNT